MKTDNNISNFKVGDRVRFTDDCPRSWWFGPHTKHKEGVIMSLDRDAYRRGRLYPIMVKVEGERLAAYVSLSCIELVDVKAKKQAPKRNRKVATGYGQRNFIVVLVNDDGTLSPNEKPVIHTCETAANTEAERLASAYPNKQFAVFRAMKSVKLERKKRMVTREVMVDTMVSCRI